MEIIVGLVPLFVYIQQAALLTLRLLVNGFTPTVAILSFLDENSYLHDEK